MSSEGRILRLTERIYAAALEPEGWDLVLAELSESLGGAAIQLALRIVDSGPDAGPVFRIHLDPKYQGAFMRHLIPWNTVDKTAALERFVCGDEMLESPPELAATPFYSEFMKPQGLAAARPLCHVIASGETRPLAAVVIYQREGGRNFVPADFELLDALAPHLRRAYQIHCQIGDARHERRALREVIDRLPSGVILLDKDSRVLVTNRSADHILALDDGIRLDRGRPRLADPRQEKAFQQLLADAVQTRALQGRSYGKTLSVLRPSGRRSFATMVGPLLGAPPGTNLREAVAILFVADPEGSQISTNEVLEGLYDLTPAEAELLRLLAEGRPLDEVAKLRGVTMNTVRSQLKQVFQKTDTRRQGELVRLVLTGVASLGDDGGR